MTQIRSNVTQDAVTVDHSSDVTIFDKNNDNAYQDEQQPDKTENSNEYNDRHCEARKLLSNGSLRPMSAPKAAITVK